MFQIGERGVAHLFLILLLVLGLGVGVFLVQRPTNFRPKASDIDPQVPQTSFKLVSQASSVTPSETFSVSILVRSDLDETNLFSTKIKFPQDLLEVSEIKEDQTTINRWVEKEFDNNEGTISLVGGITSEGYKSTVGQSGLNFGIITFKAKKLGSAAISIEENSSIHRKSDGLNILTFKNALDIKIISEAVSDSKDSDSDGFTDQAEQFIGTNPNKVCASSSSDHAWPPDTNNDGGVNGTDVSKIASFINGESPYDKRYDLNADGLINYLDASVISGYFLRSCSNPLPSSTPISTPTSSPTPSPSIEPTPSSTPPKAEPCLLNSASWVISKNPTTENDTAGMKVEGSGGCEGKQVTFEVREDDGALGYDTAKNKPDILAFGKTNSITGVWVAEFQDDGFFGAQNPPEYYFVAKVIEDNQEIKSQDPELEVVRVSTGQFKDGDANRDGKVDLADLSLMFAKWGEKPTSEIDINDDNVLNTNDYSSLLLILRQNGVLRSTDVIKPTPTPSASAGTTVSGEFDLDILYIERTPKFNYDAAQGWPTVGERVTFIAHVKNSGLEGIKDFKYQWIVDGVKVKEDTSAGLNPFQEGMLSLDWNWQSGNHVVKIVLDPTQSYSEKSEQNNELEDKVNGISLGLWIERSLYNFFNENQVKLGIGSNSYEDWAQRQVKEWNRLLVESKYPSQPNGVLDRIRLDKVVVVEDGKLPLAGGLPSNHPDRADKTVDLIWGFPTKGLLDNTFYKEGNGQPKLSQNPTNPFYLEYSLMHELSHARFLIDTYAWNLNPHPGMDDVKIIKQDGTKLLSGQNKFYKCEGGQMGCESSTPGREKLYSELDVTALNYIAGKRAKCGNYNASCNLGEYLRNIPSTNIFKFYNKSRQLLTGAAISIYQSVQDPLEKLDFYDKLIDGNPDLNCVTSGSGECSFGSNLFGTLGSNWEVNFKGLIVIKIVKGENEEFQYFYLDKPAMSFMNNPSIPGIYEINTSF